MVSSDDSARSRLAEIRAAAGVPHAQISLEVLYFLPKGFLDKYAELFSRAVKSDGGSSAQGKRAESDGVLGKARGAGAKTNGRRYKKTFVVMDERALNYKTLVDKKLRILAREIEGVLDGGEAGAKTTRNCTECRSIVSGSWSFCARCGTRLRPVD